MPQGLFNLLILGVGSVVASPTGMALVAVLLLAVFFKPPQRGPQA